MARTRDNIELVWTIYLIDQATKSLLLRTISADPVRLPAIRSIVSRVSCEDARGWSRSIVRERTIADVHRCRCEVSGG